MNIENVGKLQKILTFDTADYPSWVGDVGKCFVENEEKETITIVGWRSEMGSPVNNYRLVIEKKENKVKNWISLIGFTDTGKSINKKIYNIDMDSILNKLLESIESGNTSVAGLAQSLESIDPVGRPVTVDGRRVQVYLDDISLENAKQLGNGNVSQGIRTALSKKQRDS